MCGTKASQVVYRLSKKYGCKSSWVWEVLEESFNIFKGQGAIMYDAEIIELQETIEEYLED